MDKGKATEVAGILREMEWNERRNRQLVNELMREHGIKLQTRIGGFCEGTDIYDQWQVRFMVFEGFADVVTALGLEDKTLVDEGHGYIEVYGNGEVVSTLVAEFVESQGKTQEPADGAETA